MEYVLCVLTALCLSGFVAIFCLDAVPPLFLGVKYNHFAKFADTDHIYGPGRHFIGPFNKFLLFPSDVQNFEFVSYNTLGRSGKRFPPLHTRTKEGLALHLQVAVQYRLRADQVGKLYTTFNMLYEDVFIRTIRDTLIKAASEYEAPSLWTDRQVFGDNMQKMANKSLWDLFAECWGLQLLLVDLPDNYENRLTQTQVQNQLMMTRNMEQRSTKIRAETEVIQADYARKVKVIYAHGRANYTVRTKQAEAQARERTIEVESNTMSTISRELGMIVDDLVTFRRYMAVDDLEDSRIFWGFQGSSNMIVQTPPM